MRRFSQRSHLVTLSEINITPLLDLAFVLLIIFVITTPLLEQSINLKLPTGGRPDQKPDPRDIRTVEIATSGIYKLDKQQIPLAQLTARLAQDFRANPNLVVYIRANKDSRYNYVAQVIDGCQKNGITRYSLRTEPSQMNRLQKKCLVATAGAHLLLLLVLVFGSAFFSPRAKPDDSQVLTVIPDVLTDAPFNSGKKDAQLPPPEPPPQPPQVVQPVVTPPPPAPTPKPQTLLEPVEKSTEPEPVKPPDHQIKVNTQLVTHTVPKNPPKTTPTEDPRAKAVAALAQAAKDAARNLKTKFTPATEIETPGTGSVSYANYDSVVKSIYERAWAPPDNTESDDANTKVSVTIASDGTVLNSRIVTSSGDASVDASVQRTLDRVTFIRPFPEGAKEKERTYIINFNLKAKRMLE